jgi:hypothetical protein
MTLKVDSTRTLNAALKTVLADELGQYQRPNGLGATPSIWVGSEDSPVPEGYKVIVGDPLQPPIKALEVVILPIEGKRVVRNVGTPNTEKIWTVFLIPHEPRQDMQVVKDLIHRNFLIVPNSEATQLASDLAPAQHALQIKYSKES